MKTSDEKKELMKKHGITYEMKFIYKYKNHKYDDLNQAVNYAVFEAKNDK
ncbi:hypothetical protein OS175_09615 [Marinicella sp. S1101]|nr:hypothetical protein [Marinicella marina]MCX7554135.1 hypothetical protein [Marinicella marina]MDJ1141172.1 hypothetical protein [Marinicella marina]